MFHVQFHIISSETHTHVRVGHLHKFLRQSDQFVLRTKKQIRFVGRGSTFHSVSNYRLRYLSARKSLLILCNYL